MYRHRFDPASLVGGLLFLGIAAACFATLARGSTVPFPVIVPVLLIGLGITGLLLVIFRGRNREH